MEAAVERWISAGAAGRRLGVSREWVRQLVLDGVLHPIGHVEGLGRVFRASDVELVANARGAMTELRLQQVREVA